MNSSSATTQSSRTVRWRRLLLVAVAIGLIWTSFVMVDETEFVIIERLGTISAVYDTPETRGWHFKLPWPVEAVRRFDRRVQLFDPAGREVFTADKKNITVNAYLSWRIAEPVSSEIPYSERPVVRFYRGLGTNDVAEARLETRLRSILTTRVGRVNFDDLLNVNSSEAGPQRPRGGLLERLSQEITMEMKQRDEEAESLIDRLGIEIVDARMKRINFPEGNQQAVYDRMKSERHKIAERYRSAGDAEARMLRSRADRQSAELVARAEGEAVRIRGEAEAEAVSVLNEAHALDPEFYEYLRTLDAYRDVINDRTTLVLSASSRLFRLLTEGLPLEVKPSAAPSEPVSAPKPVETQTPTIEPSTDRTTERDAPAEKEDS
jgi:membrane protease subunit HflC